MPLIFSTYKIKLGGIIPTANLFSRFLEKNVEQAVDVFGFHTNPYAHLLNAGWEHRRYNPIEEASSFHQSLAVPFWINNAEALNLKFLSPVEGGSFSAFEQPILFLPLWHDGSWSHSFNSGLGTYKSQATYDQAHKFFTQYGYQDYELLFDKSEVYGAVGRFGQAHPFFAEIGTGLTPVYDESRTGESWLKSNRSETDFFFTGEIGQALTYDESRTGESLLAANRREPEFFYYQLHAQQMQFLNVEESSFGTYGSYDPLLPTIFPAENLGILGNDWTAGNNRFSLAQSFYTTFGLAESLKLSSVEEAGNSKWYGFNSFWFDSFVAEQIRSYKTESASLDKFNSFYFWYISKFEASQTNFNNLASEAGNFKEYIYNTFYYSLFNAADSNEYGLSVPEGVPSTLGHYPMFHYYLIPISGLNLYKETKVQEGEQSKNTPNPLLEIYYKNFGWTGKVDITGFAVDSRYSLADSFYIYRKNATSIELARDGSGSYSRLRLGEKFWHYTFSSYSIKHYNQEDSAVGKPAYYDIYYLSKYAGSNYPSQSVLPAQYKSFPVNTPWYYVTKLGANFHDAYGWISSQYPEASVNPYIAYSFSSRGIKDQVAVAQAQNSSFAVSFGVNAAFWVKPFDDQNVLYQWGDVVASSNEASSLGAYAFNSKLGENTQLIVRAAIAVATRDAHADPQPFYSMEFTGNIDTDMFPYPSSDITFGNFSQVAVPYNSYEGQRANRSYAQTFEYINSLDSGFEIFYDLNFIPPKVNVGENLERDNEIGKSFATRVPTVGVNYVTSSKDAKNFPEVHLTFNGKVIDIEDRQIWDTVSVVHLGGGFEGRLDFLLGVVENFTYHTFDLVLKHESSGTDWHTIQAGVGESSKSTILLQFRLVNLYQADSNTEHLQRQQTVNDTVTRLSDVYYSLLNEAGQRDSKIVPMHFY